MAERVTFQMRLSSELELLIPKVVALWFINAGISFLRRQQ